MDEEVEKVAHLCICDCCNKQIIGTRFKCLNCRDFDLCKNCEKDSLTIHNEEHSFLEIKYPIDVFSLSRCTPCSIFTLKNSKEVHHSIICDGCECAIDKGIRFMCVNCLNYDLCELCHLNEKHINLHSFVKAKKPLVTRVKCPIFPLIYDEINPRISNKIEIKEVKFKEKLKISFKDLSRNNVDDVLIIEHDCFPNPYTKEVFQKAILDKYSYCKILYSENELKSQPAAYILFQLISNQEIRITSLGVKREFRRHSLGEMMINKVIETSKSWKIRFITLHVMTDNTAAQRLYSKLGFKTTRWISEYYGKDDALMMFLE
jgi:ribosomal protein S18 acetylase RimI-like enzyme